MRATWVSAFRNAVLACTRCFRPEIVSVALVLLRAGHERHLRAVVDDGDAARREEPVVRVHESFLKRIDARHVVVVVEGHELVWIAVDAVVEVERLEQAAESLPSFSKTSAIAALTGKSSTLTAPFSGCVCEAILRAS